MGAGLNIQKLLPVYFANVIWFTHFYSLYQRLVFIWKERIDSVVRLIFIFYFNMYQCCL